MNKLKRGLPNFITSLGLVCGCISIVITTTQGDLNLAGYFIMAAAVFDFFDGMVARIFKVISEFGKQLDSSGDETHGFGIGAALRQDLRRLTEHGHGKTVGQKHPAVFHSLFK